MARRSIWFGVLAAFAAYAALTASPLASAETSDQDRALTFTHMDKRLKWQPCPSYFPKGCTMAALYGDLDEEDSDFYIKMPPNAPIVRHWHPTEERIVAVAGTFHITYDGQKAIVLKPGQFLYAPAELPHKGVCVTEPHCVLYVHLRAPVDSEPAE